MFGGVADLSGVGLAAPHEDGHWINENISRIVEIIRDYDPNIDVEWVPRENRTATDPAFRLIEKNPDGRRFVMFYVNDESEFDERILQRIFQSDSTKNPDILSTIDAANAAKKAVELKVKMDQMEEAHDLAAHIYRSPKARYRHGGVVYE